MVDYPPWVLSEPLPPWAARSAFACVRLSDGSMVLMGGVSTTGYYNDVWKSPDGITWTQLTDNAGWSKRSGLAAVALSDDSIVVSGGINAGFPLTFAKDVWKSEDGITWERLTANAEYSARKQHGFIRTSDDRLLVFGGYALASGYTHDVWESSDGVSWDNLVAAAPWSPREGFGHAILSDNSVILIGGNGTPTPIHDVWKSGDGETWECLNADAPFLTPYTTRGYFPAIALSDDSIVILGGQTIPSGVRSDVWHSLDGITWVEATAAAEWGSRCFMPGIAHDDGTVFMLGGTGTSGPKSDVWSSKFPLTFPTPIGNLLWRMQIGPL